jgi:hypothetical protein
MPVIPAPGRFSQENHELEGSLDDDTLFQKIPEDIEIPRWWLEGGSRKCASLK